MSDAPEEKSVENVFGTSVDAASEVSLCELKAHIISMSAKFTDEEIEKLPAREALILVGADIFSQRVDSVIRSAINLKGKYRTRENQDQSTPESVYQAGLVNGLLLALNILNATDVSSVMVRP